MRRVDLGRVTPLITEIDSWRQKVCLRPQTTLLRSTAAERCRERLATAAERLQEASTEAKGTQRRP